MAEDINFDGMGDAGDGDEETTGAIYGISVDVTAVLGTATMRHGPV